MAAYRGVIKTHLLKTSLVLLPLSLALPAFAQSANDATPPNTTSSSSPTPAPDTTPAPAADQSSVAHSDRSFAEKLALGSTNEVALSQLADSHASSDDVKSFAQMMVTDHTKLNSQLSDLASKKGVDLQESVAKGEKKGVAGLGKKNGTDFDKAYIKTMVKGHKDTAELLKKEAESKDADFAQFATQALPTVLEHLQKAEAIQKAQD